MKDNFTKRIIFVLFISIFLSIIVTMVHAMPSKSPAAEVFNFDLMETFDDIKDWQGKARKSYGPKEITSDDFPKRLDGSDTPFNVYDYWSSNDPGDDWIKDHRENGGQIWDPNNTGKGKSLCMDISHRGDNGLGNGKNWGPSRFGSYFGDGSRTSGYKSVYIFFMLWIGKNQWPTAKDSSNIGSYSVSSDYIYCASWKFMTMGHGFIKPWLHAEGIGSGNLPEYKYAKNAYGWHPNVTHLKPHANQVEIKVSDVNDYLSLQSDYPCKTEHHGKYKLGYTNIVIPTDKWIGIEIHYQLNDTNQDNGVMQIWYYDADGTSHDICSYKNLWLQNSCCKNDKINVFYIGGNNSNTYLWGDGMEPRYYIDDFIINSTRIGPTYFSKKLNSTIKPPAMTIEMTQ